MPAPRFLNLVAGRIKQVVAIVTSSGASDGEKVVATNTSGVLDDSIINAATSGANKTLKTKADGTIDLSTMPTGVGPDTKDMPASEALAAGDLVNVWNDAGTAKARKADATAEGKEANGFVISAVASAGTATVYFEGKITGKTGLTAGARQYLATTAGGVTASPPSGVNNVVQYVGVALNATEITFEAADAVTVA